MSGHSHWAGIKHHKGINDAKRAALFTKVGRNIILAAERGGGNAETNYALKIAIDAARAVNMPKDKIDRAVKRGTGELSGEAKIEEIVYEGFGPGQVAMLIETATDNKNRTVSELKSLFTKNGGKLGAPGSVMFLFRRVGLLTFSLDTYTREILELETLESGAENYFMSENVFIVETAVDTLQHIQSYFESKKFFPAEARLGYLPHQTSPLNSQTLHIYLTFKEKIEEHPDVQMIWDVL